MQNQTVTIEDLIPLRQLDGCINTISGKKFNLLEPTVEMVDLIDIAKGLAYKPHFGGMSPRFFSVAEHSLLVRYLLKKNNVHVSAGIELAALLHDAAEAYIGDMIKPLKVHLPFYCEVEDRMLKVIFERFGLKVYLLKLVKKYDLKAQEIEYNCFFKGNEYPLKYHNPEDAFQLYLGELQLAIDTYSEAKIIK